MKTTHVSKVVLISLATLTWTTSFVHIVARDKIVEQQQTDTVPTLATQDDLEQSLVSDALVQFKKIVQKKDGHLYRLSCTFKMNDNGDKVETITKAYYSDYHKQPDCDITRFSANEHNKTIEVTYTKKNSYVLLTHKKGAPHHSTKQIPLQEKLSI